MTTEDVTKPQTPEDQASAPADQGAAEPATAPTAEYASKEELELLKAQLNSPEAVAQRYREYREMFGTSETAERETEDEPAPAAELSDETLAAMSPAEQVKYLRAQTANTMATLENKMQRAVDDRARLQAEMLDFERDHPDFRQMRDAMVGVAQRRRDLAAIPGRPGLEAIYKEAKRNYRPRDESTPEKKVQAKAMNLDKPGALGPDRHPTPEPKSQDDRLMDVQRQWDARGRKA